MDAEDGAQLSALPHQGKHILRAAHAHADVVILGVVGVVALAGVALEENELAQPVGMSRHPLHVVQRDQEGVGRHGTEVHGYAQVYRVGHALAAGGDVHDGLPVGDGGVLPVHLAVAVHIAGDDHLGIGHIKGGDDALLPGQLGIAQLHIAAVLAVGNVVVVIPQSAAQADGRGGPAVLGVKLDADGVTLVAGSSLRGIGGVTGQSGGQPVIVYKGGKEVLLITALGGALIARGRIALVAAGDGICGLLTAGYRRVRFGGADRNQAVVGNLNGLHRIGKPVASGIDHICNVKAQSAARSGTVHVVQIVQPHPQLGGDGGGNVGAVIVAAVDHHGVDGRLFIGLCTGNRGLHISAVDLNGVQNGALAPQLRSRQRTVHGVLDDSGEVLRHRDSHVAGGQREGGGGEYRQRHVLHDVLGNHCNRLDGGSFISLAVHYQFISAGGHADNAVCTVRTGNRRLEGLRALGRIGLIERHCSAIHGLCGVALLGHLTGEDGQQGQRKIGVFQNRFAGVSVHLHLSHHISITVKTGGYAIFLDGLGEHHAVRAVGIGDSGSAVAGGHRGPFQGAVGSIAYHTTYIMAGDGTLPGVVDIGQGQFGGPAALESICIIGT